ncbi:MAG: hypothetical protein AAF513_19105 [Pseudomonadota bacterium]
MREPDDHTFDAELRRHMAQRESTIDPTPFADLWDAAQQAPSPQPAARRWPVAAVVLLASVGLFLFSRPGGDAADPELLAELTRAKAWRGPSDQLPAPGDTLYAMHTPLLRWPATHPMEERP